MTESRSISLMTPHDVSSDLVAALERSDNVVSRPATLSLRFRLRQAYGGLIASSATTPVAVSSRSVPRHVWIRRSAATALLLAAPRAEAHLVTTGMGAVYDGIGHFLLSPGEVLPAIGLALLAGLRGPQAGRRALLLLPLAWMAGGVAGLAAGLPLVSATVAAAAALLLLGGLILADVALPRPVILALPAAVGASLGYLNGIAIREAGAWPALLQLAGVSGVLFVFTAILAGLVVSLRQAWMRIVVRVAGSWLAAIGLLLVGWTLRGGGQP